MVAGLRGLASQLPYGTTVEAHAAATANVEREVHLTVRMHCAGGCAMNAVIENGVGCARTPYSIHPITLGAPLFQETASGFRFRRQHRWRRLNEHPGNDRIYRMQA
jgi:hypothetical protein